MASLGARVDQKQVPPILISLARKVVRAFYDPLCVIIIDLITKEQCVKLADIVDTVGLVEQYVVGQGLNKLEKDKLIKKIKYPDPDADPPAEGQKPETAEYFFIDYEMMANVTRLRLKMMQNSIKQSAMKTQQERITMECATCSRGYTDLEFDRIVDMNDPHKYTCMDCQGVVVYKEDKTVEKETSITTANFNVQLQPFLQLLKETEAEDCVIVQEIARPPPGRSLKPKTKNARAYEKQRPDNSGPEERRIVVDFGTEETSDTKKQPAWMKLADESNGDAQAQTTANVPQEVASEEITANLDLFKDTKANETGPAVGDSQAEDEEMEDADTFQVEGESVSYNDVTEDHIAKMSAEERARYEDMRELFE
eukprot:m.96064 g.96064  ORF g.96064 m.96064 type:complete len:368 (-) comp26862_c0_seq1:57-1160(-)